MSPGGEMWKINRNKRCLCTSIHVNYWIKAITDTVTGSMMAHFHVEAYYQGDTIQRVMSRHEEALLNAQTWPRGSRILLCHMSHVTCAVILTGYRARQTAPPVVNMPLSSDMVADKAVGKPWPPVWKPCQTKAPPKDRRVSYSESLGCGIKSGFISIACFQRVRPRSSHIMKH